MSFQIINPAGLGPARGYSNGVLARGGAWLFVAGQVGWNERQEIVSADFVEQFARALTNVITVVEEAGGRAGQIARLTIYVTDKDQYLACRRELGARWSALMGDHYPAIALVEVKSLLDDRALVEIEGIAVL